MMKKVRVSSILLSVVFLIFVSTKVFSATYYVDPVNGTDNPRVSTGSKQSPFKTISRAASVAIKGDSIALLPGTFKHENGERFPLSIADGVKITSAQSNHMVDGRMVSRISGKKPDGSRYTSLSEIWSSDITVEKVEISGFSTPFPVNSGGHLRLNTVVFFDNVNRIFTAQEGGRVTINDIFLANKSGGFLVSAGGRVSARTIHIRDNITSGIEVGGTGASFSATDLRFSGSPNQTLLKVKSGAYVSLNDMRIHGTGSCASPCSEKPAIKVYENASLSLEGGELKWNRPGFALYSEIDTTVRFRDSLHTAAVFIERTFSNDNTGKGLISIGGIFGSVTAPANNYQNLPLLEIKHPDGIGLELRHQYAKTEGFADVAFHTANGISIFLGKNASFSGDDLRFGNSRGTHIRITEHTSTTRSPRINGTTFSNSATVVLSIMSCSAGSAIADFRNNTWKKNTQGSSASGHYAPETATGPIFGPNVSIATNCTIRI